MAMSVATSTSMGRGSGFLVGRNSDGVPTAIYFLENLDGEGGRRMYAVPEDGRVVVEADPSYSAILGRGDLLVVGSGVHTDSLPSYHYYMGGKRLKGTLPGKGIFPAIRNGERIHNTVRDIVDRWGPEDDEYGTARIASAWEVDDPYCHVAIVTSPNGQSMGNNHLASGTLPVNTPGNFSLVRTYGISHDPPNLAHFDLFTSAVELSASTPSQLIDEVLYQLADYDVGGVAVTLKDQNESHGFLLVAKNLTD